MLISKANRNEVYKYLFKGKILLSDEWCRFLALEM